MGSRGLKQWVVTSISHMGEILDSDWSRSNLLRSDWLLPSVASMTTLYICHMNLRPLKSGLSFHFLGQISEDFTITEREQKE